MKPGLILLASTFVAFLSLSARAQIMQPLDRSKEADVNSKVLNYGNAPLSTLSQPTTVLPGSPLPKGDLKFQDVSQKKADLNTLEMNTVPLATLPKANYTAKRATADVPNDQSGKQADQTQKKAKINEREIKPFTPAGEEELKHQFNDPH